MARLILVVAFVAVIAIAITAALGAVVTVAHSSAEKDTQTMPARFQKITYTLLVVLMFGVASGWLGGS